MSYSVITFDQIKDPKDRETIAFLRGVLDKCVNELDKQGATRYILTTSRSINNEFNVDGGKFSLYRTLFSDELTVTAFAGDKKGTANTTNIDDESIKDSVYNAVESALASQPDDCWTVAPKQENGIFVEGTLDFDKDRFFDRFKELMDTIKSEYPLIMMEQSIANHERTVKIYKNSSGTEFITISGAYFVQLMYSANDGSRSSSFVGSFFSTADLDKPFIEAGTVRETLENTQKQIYTEPIEGKFVGKLVTAPDLTNEFILSALENFAGENVILDKTSVWIDKLGQKVADDRLTVKFAVNDSRLVLGQAYTDEGFKAEEYNIIDNGILTNFDLSAYISKKTGFKQAPNSGGSTIIEGGSKSIKDIIKNVDKGIYVARFSGGEPSVNGDFSGVAKNSFLIENGKLTKALSETMISGNLSDLLNNIVDISSETQNDGMNVLPYICFDNVTVSGK